MLLKGLLAFLILGAAVAIEMKGCIIPLQSKAHEHYHLQWPLVFSVYNSEILAPNAIKVFVPDDIEVLLSCAPNYLKKFHKTESVRATCNAKTGNFIVHAKSTNFVEGTELNIKDLTCDLRVIEEVQLETLSGCEKPLTASTFGYVDPITHMSLVIGEACYDTVAGITHWAHIKLGTALEHSYLRQEQQNFWSSHQHTDSNYKIKLFRGLHFDELYERMRKHTRIDETPALVINNFVDDMLLGNTQFQPVKKLGWNYFVADEELRVLNTLKQDIKSFRTNHNLELYVGSHGVMSLDDGMGGKMEVYLHVAAKDDATAAQSFPVPGLVWLLVKEQNKVTVFGVFNDADISQQEVTRRGLCQSVCEQISWLAATNKLSEAERKPLICCSYAELRQNVKEMPTLQGISGLLL